LASDKEFLKPLIQAAVQETLGAEMAETLGAEKGERTEGLGYRAGYYTRSLITRIGKIELRVPQGRQGRRNGIKCIRTRFTPGRSSFWIRRRGPSIAAVAMVAPTASGKSRSCTRRSAS